MKPDGVTMETTEPMEALVGAELTSSQVAAVPAEEKGSAASPDEEVQETAASPPAGQEGNDTPAIAEAEVEPNDSLKLKPTTTVPSAVGGGAKTKTQTKAPSTPSRRPGTVPSRGVNGSQAASKTTGPLPKKPAALAASSVRTHTGVGDKKPAGNTRVTSAPAKVANGGEGSLSNSIPKRAPAGPVNGARPRTTGEGFLQGMAWPSLLIVYY